MELSFTPGNLNYTEPDPDEVLMLARIFSRTHYALKDTPPVKSGELQRVGFIGGDFRRHPCMLFFPPIVRHSRFETYCFSTHPSNDIWTKEIKEHSNYVDISHMEPEYAQEMIRARDIQILIDLSGHTKYTGLGVMAYRPAPVQATYLGFPNTTGADAIQYRITDGITDPATEDAYYSEELVRLPGSFLTFYPPGGIEIREVEKKGTVYASFARPQKITPDVVRLWAETLKADPEGRLVLSSLHYRHGAAKKMLDRFIEAGVADRVRILPGTKSYYEHLDLHNSVDVILDTFPYNGTAGTCEALHMGTPVVTLVGKRHRSRVGLSILTAAGCDHMVAYSEDEYVNKAVALVGTKNRKLRDHVLSSPLCDYESFVYGFDEALLDMWNQ